MGKKELNPKAIKNRETFIKILDIVLIVFSVLVFVFSIANLVIKVRLTPFWVNGESMYPVLNGNVLKADGTKVDETTGNSQSGFTQVDYGLMDTHKKAINKLKRFDIVITQFEEMDESEKIKRVIGLPGEKLKFTVSPGQSEHGDLYVDSGNGYRLVNQPIENKYKVAGSYTTKEIILGNDEYYVLGDNRGHSYDSRYVGSIKRNYIAGKAIAIVGYCSIVEKDGELVSTKIKYRWPRFL